MGKLNDYTRNRMNAKPVPPPAGRKFSLAQSGQTAGGGRVKPQ